MPPPPPSGTYNALCILYSLSRILGHAARHRATQAAETTHVGAAVKSVLESAVFKAPPPSSSSSASANGQTTNANANASTTTAKTDAATSAAELRRARVRKMKQERAAEEEEFRRVLNTRWEDRNPGALVPPAAAALPPANLDEGVDFDLDIGGEEDVTSGSVRGNVRASDLGSEGMEVEGEVRFRVKMRGDPSNELSLDAGLIEEEPALRSTSVLESVPVDRPIEISSVPPPVQSTPAAVIPKTLGPSAPTSTSATITTVPTPTSTTPTTPTLPTTNTNPGPNVSELPVPQRPTRNLQSSAVPSSRIGRLFHYGGLAASLSYGAAAELIRRGTGTDEGGSTSLMLTEANVKRLVGKLSQMRGAALKLGQFMSIQDTHVLPPELDQIFRRVQDSAHYMPDWQMEQVLSSSFGPDWCNPSKPDETVFLSFDRVPFAAASIGQVHCAVLAPRHLPPGVGDPVHGLQVAVKVQFPNIANSITTDLSYVKMLLTAGRLLPKGLFLDKTISVMSAELADECSYKREAGFLKRFGGEGGFLEGDGRFKVPWVWEGGSETVLVMERVGGVGVGDVSGGSGGGSVGDGDESGGGGVREGLGRRDRNDIAEWILELCLRELFEFRTMQTDPNWTNFLWNARTRQVELVDFGATRTYTKEFMDDWLRLLQAATSNDRDACIEWSIKLGYLTGEENEEMTNAHVRSMTLLATPFRSSTPQPFAFGPSTPWAIITADIRSLIPVMLHNRLTPPPKETYSLNRKLSGAFLLASRLGAEVDTRAVWERVVGGYKFGPVDEGEREEGGLDGVD